MECKLHLAEHDSVEAEFLRRSVRELEKCNRQALEELVKLEQVNSGTEMMKRRLECLESKSIDTRDWERELQLKSVEISRLNNEIQSTKDGLLEAKGELVRESNVRRQQGMRVRRVRRVGG